MRPNIDIPWSVHGKVKDYAEDEGISLDEAYSRLIKKGVRKEGYDR
jgi:hypothetical protein